jgi:hypothetical protein
MLICVSDVLTVSIIRAMVRVIVLMMEAVSTSETSVNFYQTTRCNISEDIHLYVLQLFHVAILNMLIFNFPYFRISSILLTFTFIFCIYLLSSSFISTHLVSAQLVASTHYPLICLYQSLCPFSITPNSRRSSSYTCIFFSSILNLFLCLTSVSVSCVSSLQCPWITRYPTGRTRRKISLTSGQLRTYKTRWMCLFVISGYIALVLLRRFLFVLTP